MIEQATFLLVCMIVSYGYIQWLKSRPIEEVVKSIAVEVVILSLLLCMCQGICQKAKKALEEEK